MVEPTGYTALDLVGFTDKGTYSSSATYVKNDLVDYGGDKWQCMADDVSNVTPTEGAYWHKWIDMSDVSGKADITAIGINETGATASKEYAFGEHFYKNGKFCTAKAAIARGAQFTLNTNYVEGTVADNIDSIKFDKPVLIGKVIPTSGNTRDTGSQINIDQYLSNYKYLAFCLSSNNASYVDNLFFASRINIVPTKFIRKKIDIAIALGERIPNFDPMLSPLDVVGTGLVIQGNGKIQLDYYHSATETMVYLMFATN